jgi:hypothetical protein
MFVADVFVALGLRELVTVFCGSRRLLSCTASAAGARPRTEHDAANRNQRADTKRTKGDVGEHGGS